MNRKKSDNAHDLRLNGAASDGNSFKASIRFSLVILSSPSSFSQALSSGVIGPTKRGSRIVPFPLPPEHLAIILLLASRIFLVDSSLFPITDLSR